MKLFQFIGSILRDTSKVTTNTLGSVGTAASSLNNELEAFEEKRALERTTDIKLAQMSQGIRIAEGAKDLQEALNAINAEEVQQTLEQSAELQKSLSSKLEDLLK